MLPEKIFDRHSGEANGLNVDQVREALSELDEKQRKNVLKQEFKKRTSTGSLDFSGKHSPDLAIHWLYFQAS